jgi:hypothetical protein
MCAWVRLVSGITFWHQVYSKLKDWKLKWFKNLWEQKKQWVYKGSASTPQRLNWRGVVWSILVWPHLHRQVLLYDLKNKNSIMCKTQIHVQPLINIQSSNPCQFLHHKHLYLRSMSFFNFSNHIQFSNLWSFLTFSSPRPKT